MLRDNFMDNNKLAKPFIPWIGGKTRNLKQYRNLYPQELINNDIKRYIECFLGSGALFFDIKQRYMLNDFILLDINRSLINVFIQLRDRINDCIVELLKLQNLYNGMKMEQKKRFYYHIRDEFNNNDIFDIRNAVQFIFISKTIFNGCIRYNMSGKLNSPFGFRDRINICDTENLLKVNKLLQDTTIKCSDYKECKRYINQNSFVYFDPPYRPTEMTKTIRYSKEGFNDNKQIGLKNFYDYVSDKRVLAMLSDSYSEDGFFQDLYKNYNLHTIYRNSCIASDNKYRKPIKEFLITNY